MATSKHRPNGRSLTAELGGEAGHVSGCEIGRRPSSIRRQKPPGSADDVLAGDPAKVAREALIPLWVDAQDDAPGGRLKQERTHPPISTKGLAFTKPCGIAQRSVARLRSCSSMHW